MNASPAIAPSAETSQTVALAARYDEVRAATLALIRGLTPEDQMVQAMPDASPTKWHLAHTTWFFETFILSEGDSRYKSFDPRFTFLFNSYYKQLEGHPLRSIRGVFSRPDLETVLAYRAHVDDAMRALFRRGPAPHALELIELGLNHEQQHQELIVTDIKYAFWMNPLRPALRSPAPALSRVAVSQSWTPFAGGLQEIGHSGDGFAFDNELPRHRVYIEPFSLANRLVTNAEFLEFIADGGYQHPELWLSDGWDAHCAADWRCPLYWEQQDSEWMNFTSAGMQPVEPGAPLCHVSYYEADAFARWAGARLPSEAEWEVAAANAPVEGNFLENGTSHPQPARAHAGLQQLFGDVWEWTASPYTPYPGYRAAKGVLGEYNGKFMCNQMVLRGGSCATPQSHIRASYRNFFPPAARWQFMGIRLANDRP